MDTQRKQVLVIDDEADLRELLVITLGRMKLDATAVASVGEGLHALAERAFDLCLTDMNLPDGDGLDIIRHISRHHPDTPVAMITAYGNMETATQAMKEGAFDFIAKPVSLERLRQLINDGLGIRDTQPASDEDSDLTGTSLQMQTLRTQIHKLARSQAPIYISGESGSGKERVARLIHRLGPRRQKPFIAVNCGAIPSELMESEFFGHRKGSFSGAFEDRKGMFREADGGTLFLDEVADLPLHMQVKLLRAIQEKSVRPVGEPREFPVNIRLLCATHKDLAAEVAANRFRQDLYYRLNVIETHVPALRERPEDIPLLVRHMLTRLCQQWEMAQPEITAEAMQALTSYAFPGNVRELENILERALTFSEGQRIDRQHLQLPESDHLSRQPDPVSPSRTSDIASGPPATKTNDSAAIWQRLPGQTLEDYLAQIEKAELLDALERCHWNRTAAAKSLGLSFRSMRYRLKKLDLDQCGHDDEKDHETPQ